ncbi:MAG: hypothetical protein GX616_16180 [Planctomycetes bacterium]|nr:hypothetical protein [Planctomycetota bacterium]
MRTLERIRPGAVIGLAFTGILLVAILGALTNSVNGWVSPTYFRNIMRWHDVADIWRASIAQGILEGLMFGLAFSVIFVAVVGIVSRARCPYRTASPSRPTGDRRAQASSLLRVVAGRYNMRPDPQQRSARHRHRD